MSNETPGFRQRPCPLPLFLLGGIPVEKVKILEIVGRSLLQERVAHRTSDAVEVLQFAEEAGRPLHACGPGDAFGLIRKERISPTRMPTQRIAETDRILQRL